MTRGKKLSCDKTVALRRVPNTVLTCKPDRVNAVMQMLTD
jgi:hypothetical protein